MARILDNGHSWDDLINVYRQHIQGNKTASAIWFLEDESTRRVIEKLGQPATISKSETPRPEKKQKYSRSAFRDDLERQGVRL